MNYPRPFIEYYNTLDRKLTSLRRDVLYILWCEQKPLKAYEILDILLKTKPNATPPTVYRALTFFVASNIVHKIESIQSYTLCCEPDKHWSSEVLMVCNICHQVIEVYDAEVRTLVANITTKHSFRLNPDAIELKGLCQSCLS